MSRRRMLILISALHVCIFILTVICIGVRINNEDGSLAMQPQTETVENEVWETEIESDTESEMETVEAETVEIETIEIETVETKTETQTQTQPQYGFVNITEHYPLNIRQEPSTSSEIIGKVPRGATGDVISIENDEWALIEYDGIQGYCSMEYLQLEVRE